MSKTLLSRGQLSRVQTGCNSPLKTIFSCLRGVHVTTAELKLPVRCNAMAIHCSKTNERNVADATIADATTTINNHCATRRGATFIDLSLFRRHDARYKTLRALRKATNAKSTMLLRFYNNQAIKSQAIIKISVHLQRARKKNISRQVDSFLART